MNFHWPSFLLGYGAGVGSVLLAERFRPFLTELATSAFELFDGAVSRVAMAREDLDDVLAEAQARARGGRTRPQRKRKPKKKSQRRSGAGLNGNRPATAGA